MWKFGGAKFGGAKLGIPPAPGSIGGGCIIGLKPGIPGRGGRPICPGPGGGCANGFDAIFPALKAAKSKDERKRLEICSKSHYFTQQTCSGIDQMLCLLFHPLLVVEFDIILVFSSRAMSFPHGRRIVGQEGVAVVTVIFRHAVYRLSSL